MIHHHIAQTAIAQMCETVQLIVLSSSVFLTALTMASTCIYTLSTGYIFLGW